MYCKSCGRKKTSNQKTYLDNSMTACFSVDIEDRYCDECEAKKHAGGCINAIKANVKIKRDRLEQSTIIDEDKFRVVKDKIIAYWKKFYTPDIDLNKYNFWYERFNDTIDREFMTYSYKKKSLDIL